MGNALALWRWVMVVGVLLVAGCFAPAPLVRLAPTSPDMFWVSGRASVYQEADGVRVAAAFDHHDDPLLALHVEVENTTAQNLDLDPREFTFTTCRGEALATCGGTQRVVDPEQVLESLGKRRSRETAEAASSQAVFGVLVILSAVSDIASVAGGHSRRSSGGGTTSTAALARSDEAARQTRLASIATQQQVWSTEALRRNTLFPGRGAGGRVYIPIDLDATRVWLHVRTGGRVVSFPFQQTVKRLDPYPSRTADESGWSPAIGRPAGTGLATARRR